MATTSTYRCSTTATRRKELIDLSLSVQTTTFEIVFSGDFLSFVPSWCVLSRSIHWFLDCLSIAVAVVVVALSCKRGGSAVGSPKMLFLAFASRSDGR